MYDYLVPEVLDALERHHDSLVRHAVEDLRQANQELLLAKMREISFRYLQNWDDPQAPHMLWQAVEEGPESITEAECLELDRLRRTARGWWIFGASATPEFLDTAAWIEEYRER